jgi:hypothetical protein
MPYLASDRGVENATLVDPGAAPPYTPSARGKANATLAAPVLTPSGWTELAVYQRVASLWETIGLSPARIIQYTQTPALGYVQSQRGTANATVGSWMKPKIGVIGSNETTFNSINDAIGLGTVRRTYNTTLPSSWATSAAASDVAANRESYWSWKPDLLAFPTSTSQKNAFSAFLDTIPDGHKAVIMAWHEPENDIPGSYSLVQWGALQNAVATIVKSKNRPELRTGFCLMGPWTFDTRSGRTSWDWEGALDFDLIDVVGIDPYGTIATGSGSTMSLETMLTIRNSGSGTGTAPSMMEKLASWGKPISIMEFGKYFEGPTVAPESLVATWLTDAYEWMKEWNQAHRDTPIESAIYYSMTILSPPEDTPLTGAEITAYAAIVADSKVPV